MIDPMDQENRIWDRIQLAIRAEIRQEIMGYWSRIAVLENEISTLKAELKKAKDELAKKNG